MCNAHHTCRRVSSVQYRPRTMLKEAVLSLLHEHRIHISALHQIRSNEVGITSQLSVEAPPRKRRRLHTQPTDTAIACTKQTFVGCTRLRRINAFLNQIDANGFERSNHQCRFHDAFMKACARTIYKEEWGIHRTAIMRRNNWATSRSEVMVSTPRRFGKTFSCAVNRFELARRLIAS